MIPLPRPRALASAMLLGTAMGLLVAVGVRLLAAVQMRPDVVVALVLWVPSGVGLVLILIATRRAMINAGVFLLALATSWFGVLTLGQVMGGV